MRPPSTRSSASRSARARNAATIAASTALLMLPIAGSAPAWAGTVAARPDTASPVSVSALPEGEVEQLLSSVPLKDLSATQLSGVLSQLPGLSGLPAGHLQEALTKSIEGLAGKGDTLGQLASSPELVTKLEGQLDSLLSISELLSFLSGQSLSSVLTSALGSLDSSEMLSGLLSSSAEPEQLIEQVLAAPSPGKLQALLGTTLTGEPFASGTVGELASNLGMTPEALAKDLNTTSSQLPASAMALTAPLTDGKTLGVLNGLDGVDLGLLGVKSGELPEAPGGAEGPGSGSGGSGDGSGESTGGAGGPGSGSAGSGDSTGGSGGSSGGGAAGSGATSGSDGAPGTPTNNTLIVNYLPGQSSLKQSPRAKTIKILRCRVKGDKVTIVVQVPAAGRLSVSAMHVRSVSKRAGKTGRLTLRADLTKAGIASLRSHRRRLKVKLRASFKLAGGRISYASRTVVFN
jgi:hypothetical protein